ncbi:MAG: hypothetical protein AB2693_03000 [Candidatus Thiodiazotropha sp.]
MGLVGQGKLQPRLHQPVDRRKKGGQGLTGAGGRRDQGVLCRLYRRPGLRLDLGGPAELPLKPCCDCRVKLER